MGRKDFPVRKELDARQLALQFGAFVIHSSRRSRRYGVQNPIALIINLLDRDIIHISSTISLSVQSPPRSLATQIYSNLTLKTTIPLLNYSRK